MNLTALADSDRLELLSRGMSVGPFTQAVNWNTEG
jgi:hypothetical protein